MRMGDQTPVLKCQLSALWQRGWYITVNLPRLTAWLLVRSAQATQLAHAQKLTERLTERNKYTIGSAFRMNKIFHLDNHAPPVAQVLHLDRSGREEPSLKVPPLPLPSKYGTYKAVKTRFWPWLLGQSPLKWIQLGSAALLADIHSFVSQKVLIKSFLQESIPAQIRQLIFYYYEYQ